MSKTCGLLRKTTISSIKSTISMPSNASSRSSEAPLLCLCGRPKVLRGIVQPIWCSSKSQIAEVAERRAFFLYFLQCTSMFVLPCSIGG